MKRFNGKSVIVTGSSSGIGRFTAILFAKTGAKVNCAGANLQDGTMNTDQSMSLCQKTFQINFEAVVGMIKKCKDHLIKTKGEIVNVSSIAGEGQALSGTPYYSASKAALNLYTRCVAIDLIQYGVRVNSVSPGVLETFLASKKDCIPVGFCGRPKDIAEIILFLADRKKSGYIIGQSIVADGGSSLVTAMQSYDIQDMI